MWSMYCLHVVCRSQRAHTVSCFMVKGTSAENWQAMVVCSSHSHRHFCHSTTMQALAGVKLACLSRRVYIDLSAGAGRVVDRSYCSFIVALSGHVVLH